MAYIKRLLTVCFLFSTSLSFAGYAQLASPAGWSAPASVGLNASFRSSAANSATYLSSTVRTNASLNVGGQAVTMPVTMRYAANAATVVASAMSLSPLSIGIAGAAWLATQCIVFESGSFKLTCGGSSPAVQSNGFEYLSRLPNSTWSANMNAVCQDATTNYARIRTGNGYTYSFEFADTSNGIHQVYCAIKMVHPSHGTSRTYEDISSRSSASCPSGYYVTSSGCSPTQPSETISPAQVVEKMASKPIPDALPLELPTVQIPVLPPTFNPDPAALPSAVPVSRPLFLPTGNPVATSDPAVFNQPGLHIIPAPTSDSPWRVDVQPKLIPQDSATPKTFQQLNPNDSPLTGQPNPTPGLCDIYPGILACTPTATIQDKLDFCKSNPDVIACQKIENVQSDDLQTKNISSLITPDSGWGSDNASCPAARKLSIPGAEFSFQMMCDFSSGIRPIILALAWLSAAFILLGMRGSE